MPTIEYTPRGAYSFSVRLIIHAGCSVAIDATGEERDVISGDRALSSNKAVTENLLAFAKHELRHRRVRNAGKKKSHREEADRHARVAKQVAELAVLPVGAMEKGWCSGCMTKATHDRVVGARTRAYLCTNCGSPTIGCAVPRCQNFAARGRRSASRPRYCAELNRTGSDGGSGYWISTSGWSVRV